MVKRRVRVGKGWEIFGGDLKFMKAKFLSEFFLDKTMHYNATNMHGLLTEQETVSLDRL
jgi:hypothetical protein